MWPQEKLNIFILSNGVDLTKFNPKNDAVEIRKKWGFQDNKIILHLGRIAQEKNLDTFIKAAPTVKKEYPDSKFIIVGTGPAEEFYKKMVKRLNLSNDFIFTGYVPDELIPKYYACADAFTTSSTFETQGIVILEAMASGLPVSGANYRAIPELVKDGENGFLFDAFDPKDCANAIIKTLEPDSKIRKNALKTVQEHSMERVVDRLIGLYEEMYELRSNR